MIERADVDPGAAARDGFGGTFAMAARLCLSCPHACACRGWLDSGASGAAPDFCRNIAFLRRVSAVGCD